MSELKADAEVPSARRPRARTRRFVLPEQLPVALFLIALLIFFSVSSSQFATTDNWSLLLSNVAAFGLIAIGQTLVIIAGGFDLSVAGVAPLSAVLFATLTNDSWGIGVALIAMLLLGLAVGLVNGVLVSSFGINPLITTLATLSVTGGLAFVVSKGQGIAFDHVSAGVLGEPLFGNITVAVIVWAALILVTHLFLRYSVLGRTLYCLGGNREASWLAGLPVRSVSIGTYCVCSALAALAGVAIASQLLSAEGNLASTAALTSVAAVVLGGGAITGGRGGMPGTLLGVLILGVLQNGLVLLQVNSFYQQIATGCVLLLAVGIGRIAEIDNPLSFGRNREVEET